MASEILTPARYRELADALEMHAKAPTHACRLDPAPLYTVAAFLRALAKEGEKERKIPEQIAWAHDYRRER
jgi:hypothetical protein